MVFGYDQALQLPTVDLYDTLLMAMALNAAKDMYEKGEQLIKDFLKAYGDFLTPITADLDWYNKNVTGAARDFINKIYARGGDPLRNAQDRAMVALFINNIPYGEIAKMKSSAENVKDYLKNRAELQAKGLWNPDMEAYAMGGKSLEDWDTLKDGAWTRTSPVMYKSMDDIIEPIVSKLEPTFDAEMTAAKHDGFDYSTVSRQRILDTINDSMLDLIGAGTAEGYYYSKALEAAGNDPDKAKALLRDWYANRASNHVRTLREANQFKLDDHRTANDMRAASHSAAVNHHYNMIESGADINGDGKLSKGELSAYASAGGSRDKHRKYNIFREAEARSGEDISYELSAALENYIRPMSNKIQYRSTKDGKNYVYIIPGSEVGKVLYTDWSTSKANTTNSLHRYVGHGGDSFDKNKDYVFVQTGGLRHKNINGVDRYFIGGYLRDSEDTDNNYSYDEFGTIPYEMEVKETYHEYTKKKGE